MTASCETSADCDSSECGVSVYDDGCGATTLLGCRTDEDQCRVADACEEGDAQCALAGAGATRWECLTQTCDIGRPVLQDDRPVVAEHASRGDWRTVASDGGPRFDTLAPDPELAAHWTKVALLEHASVGSFARFTLQLLALGAPPELLAETQQAAADEVVHARLAFGLASAYAGRPVGPGPLNLTDLAVSIDIIEVVRALVREACIGETLGAAEAAAAATVAWGPAKAVLAQIAGDEARHAALAWKSLQWLIQDRPDLAAMAHELVEDAVRAVDTAPVAAGAGRPADGLLSPEALRRIHRDALRELVRPCLAAA